MTEFDPADREQYYLVAKGARTLAIVDTVDTFFDRRRLASFKVSRLLFRYPWNEPDGRIHYILYVEGRSDKEAQDLKQACMDHDEAKIGLLLGYAPDLVKEYIVRARLFDHHRAKGIDLTEEIIDKIDNYWMKL